MSDKLAVIFPEVIKNPDGTFQVRIIMDGVLTQETANKAAVKVMNLIGASMDEAGVKRVEPPKT